MTTRYAPRANRYAADCYLCGQPVAAGAGQLVKRDGRWAVMHRGPQWVGAPTSGRYIGGCPDGPAPEPVPFVPRDWRHAADVAAALIRMT